MFGRALALAGRTTRRGKRLDLRRGKFALERNISMLRNYALLNVKDRLARIEGVGHVQTWGGGEYAMRVWLDPQKVAQHGLSASDVVRAIREQNLQAAAGVVGASPGLPGVDLQLSINAQGRLQSEEEFGDTRFEDLPVTFGVCAASIERAAEHWFTSGPIVPAILASAAVPGLLPPAEVDGEHFLDGGLVNSIPVGRAVELGATRIFVLQVGRIDRPLKVPTRPWEVARVSFEVARRHRFMRDMATIPEGVEAHVLPAAGTSSRDDSVRWRYSSWA